MHRFPLKYSPQGEDTEKKADFQFCKVCNINQEHGMRHKYFPSHRTRTSKLLSRFDSKLAELRTFLSNGAISTSRTTLWCIFCDCDIMDSSSYLPENAISHLSSMEHRKKVKHFLWKYGKREPDNADTFCLLESDVSKWDSKRKSLGNDPRIQIGPSNYIQTKLQSVESSYASKYPNHDLPLQHHTNEFQIHSSTDSIEHKGSKLNPKRVGAEWAERRKIEIEMEERGEIPKRNYGPNWLPNFGRVWQSGSRKESLRDFVAEKTKLPNGKEESVKEKPTFPNTKQHLEGSLSVQPYISKRIRKDGAFGS